MFNHIHVMNLAYEKTPQVPLNCRCGVETPLFNRIIGGHPVLPVRNISTWQRLNTETIKNVHLPFS